MTSFSNDVAVFVPRFRTNPNCISLKLGCLHLSRIYNSKILLKVDVNADQLLQIIRAIALLDTLFFSPAFGAIYRYGVHIGPQDHGTKNIVHKI